MTVKAATAKSSRPNDKGVSKVRWDIQGLRALAVMAVIADHLFKWPRGGFVGVDVFFVISGFLITGLLLREHERTGTISFKKFYVRRIKRIIPASVLVLVVTAGLGFVLFTNSRALQTALDSVWALFFSANWRFIAVGTDYFQADGPVSPLQHYWSLGVEEQFYFVWPWLMLLIFILSTRRRRRGGTAHGALAVTMSIIVFSSFSWSLIESEATPTWAYFSTFSRAWELGVGALLAVLSAYLEELPRLARMLLAWAGLSGIIWSIFTIDSSKAFPGPWAAMPVASTALVIAAGTGGEHKHLFPLTNRVSRYVGDISYSLYLWHFPVIIFAGVMLRDAGGGLYAISIAMMVGLAVSSYHLIENPIRKSAWLEGGQKRVRADGTASAAYVRLAVLAATTSVLVAIALIPRGLPPVLPPGQAKPLVSAGSVDDLAPFETQLVAALKMDEWPPLQPSVDDLEDAKPLEEHQGCGTLVVADSSLCSFGKASRPTIVVFGDSTGLTLLPTVRAAFGDTYNVRGLSLAGCPVIALDMRFVDPGRERDCLAYRGAAIAEINKSRPALVLLTNTYTAALELRSRAGSQGAATEWSEAVRRTRTALSASGARILAVSPPPIGRLLEECATPISSPKDCASRIPDLWFTISDAERRVLGEQNYVDTHRWFCAKSNECPSFVGATPLKRDAVHTTRQYAVLVAPLFKAVVSKKLGSITKSE